jgi:hypothetical protein
MSTKKLTLSHGWLNPKSKPPHADYLYRVESVSNSVSYTPKQFLNKDEVSGLCDNEAWDVRIVPIPKK